MKGNSTEFHIDVSGQLMKINDSDTAASLVLPSKKEFLIEYKASPLIITACCGSEKFYAEVDLFLLTLGGMVV
jgi:hypothetical protein